MKLFFYLVLPLFTLSCESVEVVHHGTNDARPLSVDMYYAETEAGAPIQVFDFSMDSGADQSDLAQDLSLDFSLDLALDSDLESLED